MIRVEDIRATVDAYLIRHPDEVGRLAPLTTALDADHDLTSRKTLPGHVTCSALVCDPAGRVLHIRHNVLNRWLCPGGHLEPHDTTLAGGALREITEETGIPVSALRLIDEVPIDIDVHPIPANPAKSEPDHQHFDLRYAFTTTAAPQVVLQTEEVHDFGWLPTAEIEPAWLAGRLTDPQWEIRAG
ncbi:8-oxo-dGTP pyrophosphatase MutT (NUDIX family) [Krasilnikovia cinnamomea]|uniref:8-oxo-dGTP pyrophosphatase MutT (NUDIX family) n=1 Tax=Krasilnikovia cinnamomea TaxID=349313 RepID=A0A4Q7ZHM2_9ACTN|nr:NUDIX hydrolase [Krasilnikovia cinnamomea]RZU49914.1 8-oxo-dGTP pyrophosphatase MutT (NUDIX family) [Krasilnikovia cinnamomea]